MGFGVPSLHRLRKRKAYATIAKYTFPFIFVIFVVKNVSPLFVQRSQSPILQPGEIGHTYIRSSMPGISNRDLLLQFSIPKNGSADDVSKGGGGISVKEMKNMNAKLQTYLLAQPSSNAISARMDINTRDKVTITKGVKEEESHLKSNIGNVSRSKTPYCKETRTAILKGRLVVHRNVKSLSQPQTDVDAGGHFRPSNCLSSEKLAIIIPFRNREQHLAILLLNLYPVLKRQGVDFTVFVIEENMPTPFNRAMLFNVGFLEAEKISKFDCFIFHDVDLVPIDDRNIYQCERKTPKHFSAAVDKFKYKLPYKKIFGGVVAFTRYQYLKINGASNLYFGWGGEDDDLRRRCIKKFKRVTRTAMSVGLYDMIEHEHHENGSNKVNPLRRDLMLTSTDRQDAEGLNTMRYHVTSINRFPLYTKISVDIDFKEVLKTAPAYMSLEMQQLQDSFLNSTTPRTPKTT